MPTLAVFQLNAIKEFKFIKLMIFPEFFEFFFTSKSYLIEGKDNTSSIS
jgi:hypothetical protein